MSHESIELGCLPEEAIGIGNPDLQGESISDTIDGSGPLFSMYLSLADEADKVMAKGWKKDADGVILFAGLFSAAVAVLLPVSMNDLRQNSSDIMASYMANIYQLLSATAGSHVDIPPGLSHPPDSFSPPLYAVWVNLLWFLSLANSLGCALLATLVKQWAHRYIKRTRSRHRIHKRARIREFFAEGVNHSHLPLLAEFLPLLLHISFFAFFAGLILFLFHVNGTISVAVNVWVSVYMIAYLRFTIRPIFSYNSPYYTLLSSLVLKLVHLICLIVFKTLRQFTRLVFFLHPSWQPFSALEKRYCGWAKHDMWNAAEESALNLSTKIDGRALVWTLKSLDDDNKQVRFFENIPGFCSSKVLRNPLEAFDTPNGEQISEALVGLMHRTLSSDSAPEVKRRRLDTCWEAMRVASLPITWPILGRVLYKEWRELLYSVEFGLFLSKAYYRDTKSEHRSKCVVAAIIATVEEHDEQWLELITRQQLNLPKAVLENYKSHGDTILLANCIDNCRRMIKAYLEHQDWAITSGRRSRVLEIVSRSKLNARNALPEMQRDFCRLWNELVSITAENQRIRRLSIFILRYIRGIYIALHQDTDGAPIAFDASTNDDDRVLLGASSYPLCKIPEHGSIDEAVVNPSGETPPTIQSPAVTSPTSANIPSLPLNISHSSLHISSGDPFDASESQRITQTTTLSLPPPPPLERQRHHGPALSLDIAAARTRPCAHKRLSISSIASSDSRSTSTVSSRHSPTSPALPSVSVAAPTPIRRGSLPAYLDPGPSPAFHASQPDSYLSGTSSSLTLQAIPLLNANDISHWQVPDVPDQSALAISGPNNRFQ